MIPEDGPPKSGEGEDRGEEESTTDSVDLTGLFSKNFTVTGSFDLRGVQAKSLHKLLDSLPMPVLLVDEGYSVAYANDSWDKLIGEFDKIKGREFDRLFPDQRQAAEVHNLLDRTFADRKPRNRKWALNTGRRQIWGRMHLRSLRVGKRRYILVLYQDLTVEKEQLDLIKKRSEQVRMAYDQLEKRVEERTADLKQANARLLAEIAERKITEQALRESEANYRAIFEAANDAILVQDVDTFQILDANSKVCEIFGYTPDELRNLTLRHLSADQQAYLEKDPSQWLKKAAEGTPQLFEWFSRNKAGRSFWVEVNLKGAVIGGNDRLLAVVRDITERKQLEERLREAQKMEAVGRLAGGVAHDFNNVLTAILGQADMLRQQLSRDPTQQKRVDMIIEGAQRATDLTRELLAFSRKQLLDLKAVDLNDIIRDMEDALIGIVGETIQILMLLDTAIPKVKVDSSQIGRMMLNLAVNARDAMPNGGELIIETLRISLDAKSARVMPDMEAGEYVMLAVSDTGVGMTSETASRIFEPFFTTKREGQGAGLGLAMVYGIMKQHHGHVTVRSLPGMGSTFKMYWPAFVEGADAAQQPIEPMLSFLGAETVLLVEDESLVRELTREILEMFGYRILEATDPEDAIRVSESYQGTIHLLLTDVVMPIMDGYSLYEQLLRLRRDIKALFMSGYTEHAIVHHGVLKPGLHFLQKPFNAQAVARKVREALDSL
jgi:two-component system, cell cycle sensor histidine kinase and response regulator CckA